MIEIDGVNKSFGRLQVLKDISARFQQGGSYAIVGPNGSGKTTLIKSILGMVLPDSGTIRVDNDSVIGHWSYRRKIGYMPQIGRYPDNMKMGQIEELQLTPLFAKRMHTLSGGTRQKVSAAISFLFDPEILILDEPTAGLDPLSVEILKTKILKAKSRGKVFLITSHIMSDLDELSSDIMYLEEGVIRYSDSIDNLKLETGEEKLGRAIAGMMRNNFNRSPR